MESVSLKTASPILSDIVELSLREAPLLYRSGQALCDEAISSFLQKVSLTHMWSGRVRPGDCFTDPN